MNYNATILVREVAARIEEASASIVMDLKTWETLCLIILPEWYQDRPDDDRGATQAEPGSNEKIQVISERVKRDRSPFHPQDFTIALDHHLSNSSNRLEPYKFRMGAPFLESDCE